MKFILMLFVLIFNSFCMYQYQEGFLASELVDEAMTSEDRRRRAVTRRNTRDNQCEEYDRCVDICDQLLDHAEDQEDCYKLSLKDIGRIENVFISLKDKDLSEKKLSEIRSKEFNLFIEYGSRSWINIMQGDYRGNDDYGSRTEYTDFEKSEISVWVLDHSWVIQSIEESSYGDLVLEELFNQSYTNSDIIGTIDYNKHEDYKFKVLDGLLDTNTQVLSRIDDTQLGHLLNQNYSERGYNFKKEVLFFILDLDRSTQNTVVDIIILSKTNNINSLLDQDYINYKQSEKNDICDFIDDYDSVALPPKDTITCY